MMSRILSLLFCTGVVVLIGGCVASSASHWNRNAIKSDAGNLVAFWVDYHGDYENLGQVIEVTSSYGVVIVWRGDERLFLLYDNVKKQICKTDDYDEFLQAFGSLPKGAEFQQFFTCCSGLAYSMPKNEWQRFHRIYDCREYRQAVDPGSDIPGSIICTCESNNGVRFP